RIDRASVVVAFAYAALCVALSCVDLSWFDVVQLGTRALFYVAVVLATLLAMAVAMAAVARGSSPWVAYPMAAASVAVVGLAAAHALDPIRWIGEIANPAMRSVAYLSSLSAQLVAPAILFVQHANATLRVVALRRLEAERASQADRVAQERLLAERSTIDHDLVVAAMRFALELPEPESARAELALETVAHYLRVAQQRNASDRQAVVVALHALRQICAGRDAPERATA
ncbi:MAG: hypothetical protein JO090_03360, partial [Rhizobacter sp.]|nr:hypothetical protein [Rhizobacter sp.]